ncbi:MAG: DNAase [Thiothrix nivea]|nr:MAG: DNAase [Thiothrix nivea]
MHFIDTHCHFDFPVFDADRPDLVQSMQQAGVSDLIFPAVTAITWPRLKKLADSSPHFHASYGLHPMFMATHRTGDIAQLRQWLEDKRPVAVGECGLDFYIPGADKTAQTELFKQQLWLAKDFDLPLIIHARKALDEIMKYIRQTGSVRGVIHSFSGSRQQAERLIEQGFYLGVGGTITYERAKRLRKVMSIVPTECLLLETDAPDQPDSNWSGKRNEPARLPVIAAALAKIRQTSPEQIAAITTRNAQQLFGIMSETR